MIRNFFILLTKNLKELAEFAFGSMEKAAQAYVGQNKWKHNKD
jgi:hypothetical protein